MGSIREAKTEVVDTVRTRLDESSAAVVTEYRGLTVAEMAALRKAIRAVGGDYKVFKNTLVRRAVSGSDHEPLTELLEGPTAIAFVSGDVSAVAKALRDFAKGAPALIVKGGVLDGALLGARELGALADLPSREVLLAMFAGALAAPMRTMAGLLKAVPQSFAYGLSALIESKGGVPVAEAAPVADDSAAVDATTDAPATDAADEAPAGDEVPAAEGGSAGAEEPAADAVAAEAEAPPVEASAAEAGAKAEEPGEPETAPPATE